MAAWSSVLGDYQPGEVEQALRLWQSNTELNMFTGRTYGSMMPAPSELKTLVCRARREERARPRFCGECREGLVPTTMRGLDGRQVRAMAECSCVTARRGGESVGA